MGFLTANWKWLLSGTAFIVYVAVQHGIYISLIRACRQFKEAIGDEVTDPSPGTPGGFVWLQSVRALFWKKEGGWIDNSPLPREAIIDSLNNEVWRTSRYLALQRWGLAAPLIGVILSALGFMVAPPEFNNEVNDIMTKLSPLFVGVFVGALMAIVNQVYLHLAGVELGKVRTKAVRWFDQVVWGSIRQNAHNVLGQAAAETQAAATALEASSRQLATCNISYRDSMLELNQQLSHVRAAAKSSSMSFDAFSAMIANMTERVGGAIHVLNETSSVVANTAAVWNVAAEKLTFASTAIEGSSRRLEDTCGSVREGLEQSAGGISDAADRLREPIANLSGSIDQMRANAEHHTQLATALDAAMAQSKQFLDERMALNIDEATAQQEMANRTKSAIESLQNLADTVGPIKETGASLNTAASGLKDASATIHTALSGLLETTNSFSTRCADVNAAMTSGVAEATAGLQGAARELASPVQQLNDSVSTVSAASQQNAELTARLESVARLGERFLQEHAQSNGDRAARFNKVEGIEKRLDETTRMVAESANAMRQLQQGLDALVSELRMARENNTGRGGWLSWLSARRAKNPVSTRDTNGGE